MLLAMVKVNKKAERLKSRKAERKSPPELFSFSAF